MSEGWYLAPEAKKTQPDSYTELCQQISECLRTFGHEPDPEVVDELIRFHVCGVIEGVFIAQGRVIERTSRLASLDSSLRKDLEDIFEEVAAQHGSALPEVTASDQAITRDTGVEAQDSPALPLPPTSS